VWRHITAVGRCTNPGGTPVGTTELYVDGVFVGSINRVVINDIKGIGCFQGTHSATTYPNPQQQFADYLDEYRVAGVARSAAWVWADHQNQSSAPGFASRTAPIQAGDPLLIAQSATAVGATNATFNGFIYIPGNGTMDVTVHWGVEPGVWTGSRAVAPQSGGAFDAVLSPLLPGKQYFCAFYATNTVGGAWVDGWSATTSFTTQPLAPILVVGPATWVQWNNATVGCNVLWPGVSGAVDLTVFYGIADGGNKASAWQASASVPGATVGVNGALLSALEPSTTYYFRWFGGGVWSEAGMFTTVPSGLPSGGQTWMWTGEASPYWNNIGNWTNTATGYPQDIGELSGRHIWLVQGNPHKPLHQDIPNLHVNQLRTGAFDDGTLVVDGLPFAVLGNYGTLALNDVAFSNAIAFSATGGAYDYSHNSTVRFYGPLSEFNGRKTHTTTWANSGRTHYCGPVAWSGGFSPVYDQIYFYGMETTGAAATPFNAAYFNSINGNGNARMFFMPPPNAGAAGYEYEFPPEKGVTTPVQFHIAAGVAVVFNAPVAGGGGGSGFYREGAGILELNAAAHTFAGTINADNSPTGLFLFKGTPGPGGRVDRGIVDLDGTDMPGRGIEGSWSGGGHNDDGLVRNQNPDRPSLVSGNLAFAYHSRTFGGLGDIIFTGVNNNTSTDYGNHFTKAGVGTLTLAGETSDTNRATTVLGGTLALDYAANPNRKLGADPANGVYRAMTLRGGLDMLGSAAQNTVETAAALATGGDNANDTTTSHAAVRVRARGREGKTATFRFASLNAMAMSTLDFAASDNGAIRSSAADNLAHTGALTTRVTFNGASFARVSKTDVDADGYRLIEAFPDAAYSNNFIQGANTSLSPDRHEFVDVRGNLSVAQGSSDIEIAAAIRFNDPAAPASLAIGNFLRLIGDNANNDGYNGAILVTTNTGPHASRVTGGVICDNCRNGSLYIHQYNTRAPLVIESQINAYASVNENASVTKAGPGEVILENTASAFGMLRVLEGAVTFREINDCVVNSAASASPLGLGFNNGGVRPILLGNATLRYAGTTPAGHATNRQIHLRGKGVLDASGAGKITYTNPNFVLAVNTAGINHFLTLDGEAGGVGEIQGRVNLNGGRLRKRGPGEWVFAASSTNSWTWGTDVLDGTLTLDGFMGRDVTVKTGGTIAGSGHVQRHLFVEDGATLRLDPAKGPLTIGKHLSLALGAKIQLSRKIPSVWTPILVVGGEIKGEIPEKQDNAYFKVEGGTVYTRFRPRGTLMILR